MDTVRSKLTLAQRIAACLPEPVNKRLREIEAISMRPEEISAVHRIRLLRETARMASNTNDLSAEIYDLEVLVVQTAWMPA